MIVEKMNYEIEFKDFDPETTTEHNANFYLTYGDNKFSVWLEGGKVTELLLNSEKDTTYISPDHYHVFMVTDGNKIVSIDDLLDHVLLTLPQFIDEELKDYHADLRHEEYVRSIR